MFINHVFVDIWIGFIPLLSIIHENCGFVQFRGSRFMLEFEIRLGSVRDVQDFVDIASIRPFSIVVRDAQNKINADSFMELFCLDFSRPLRTFTVGIIFSIRQ